VVNVVELQRAEAVGVDAEQKLQPLVPLHRALQVRVDVLAQPRGHVHGPPAGLFDLPQALEQQLLEPARRDGEFFLEAPPVHERLQPRRRHPRADPVREPLVEVGRLRLGAVQLPLVKRVAPRQEGQLVVRRPTDHVEGVL
jgi:hypothetical protein